MVTNSGMKQKKDKSLKNNDFLLDYGKNSIEFIKPHKVTKVEMFENCTHIFKNLNHQITELNKYTFLINKGLLKRDMTISTLKDTS